MKPHQQTQWAQGRPAKVLNALDPSVADPHPLGDRRPVSEAIPLFLMTRTLTQALAPLMVSANADSFAQGRRIEQAVPEQNTGEDQQIFGPLARPERDE